MPVYVPCERSLPLTYLPLFFIVSMKMGHAYIGSDCPERHFRSNYPEVTTRRNDPILSWSHLRASLIHELAEDPSIRIYYPSCDSIPSNLPHVSVFGALQEASSVDLFNTRSNPLSPASFNLRDLAEELSPNPKSRVACEWLAVHAILLCSNISIAVYASLMCMVRLLCQFTLRFLELMKIVRVCWESHLSGLWTNFRDSFVGVSPIWDQVLVSGIGLGSGSYAICSHLASVLSRDLLTRRRIEILSKQVTRPPRSASPW